MFWKRDDGIAVAEMITLFALVGIMTFSALPFYNNLIRHTHRAKVEIMYNKIKTTIILSAADSASVHGKYTVPLARQLASNKIVSLSESNNWTNNGSGTWTYLPTGAQIIYDRVERNDFSLRIEFPE